MDPMTIAYNTALMPEEPDRLRQTWPRSSEETRTSSRTRSPSATSAGPFGFTVAYALTEANPDVWERPGAAPPAAQPETSLRAPRSRRSSPVSTWPASSSAAAPRLPGRRGQRRPARRRLPEDGTVVLPRGIGIAPDAPHANTAKLFLDFVLSDEGQARGRRGRPDLLPRRRGGRRGPAHLPGGRRRGRRGQGDHRRATSWSPTPRCVHERWNGLLDDLVDQCGALGRSARPRTRHRPDPDAHPGRSGGPWRS